MKLPAALAAVTLLGACGPAPAAGAGPHVVVSSAAGAVSPVDAVTELVPGRPGTTSPCYPAGGAAFADARCPVTERLRARLVALPAGAKAATQPVCRCPHSDPQAESQLAVLGSLSATVTVDFSLTDQPDMLRFSVIRRGPGWLVDDTDCGDPTTSIYLSPVRGCST